MQFLEALRVGEHLILVLYDGVRRSAPVLLRHGYRPARAVEPGADFLDPASQEMFDGECLVN
jgi:hypothetical protein